MVFIDTRSNWTETAPLVDVYDFRHYAEQVFTPPVDCPTGLMLSLAEKQFAGAAAVVVFGHDFERFGKVSVFCRRKIPAYG